MNKNSEWRGQSADFAESFMQKQKVSKNRLGEHLVEDSESWWYDEK